MVGLLAEKGNVFGKGWSGEGRWVQFDHVEFHVSLKVLRGERVGYVRLALRREGCMTYSHLFAQLGFVRKLAHFVLSFWWGFFFFFLLVTKSERTGLCKNLHPLEEVHGLFSIVKSKGHSATVTKEIYWKKKLWMVVPSNDETQNHGSYMCNVKETLRSHKHSSKNWWFVKCWVLILFL